jgi:hypothetical protein
MSAVAAFVPDLMDRTRIEAAARGRVMFVSKLDDLQGLDVDVVVVDLTRVERPEDLRRFVPRARIIVFGPHVDHAVLEAAREVGVDDVLPRSTFFKTVGELLA